MCLDESYSKSIHWGVESGMKKAGTVHDETG